MIEAVDLTKKFGQTVAVDHLNLQIPRGEIFGLVGPDGAGKTTTLRLLSGLLDLDDGRATLSGYDVARQVEAVRDNIGYMAQRFGLYSDLTVQENMEFYGDLFNVMGQDREALMTSLLRMTRMEPFRKRRAGRLSGGMKQKLALMCTLLHHPQILLLDEPTNGVDPVSRRDFWAILYQLVKEGMTVLVTTAYLDEAERCNRVGLLDRGRLVRCESPNLMRNQFEARCYELQCPDKGAARRLLQVQSGVVNVEPSGSTLHLFLTGEITSIDHLSQLLEQNALGPAVFKAIVPSLEDVFIALIRKREEQDHEP
jgi:ABC-2 type transport system ATP-binding protein